MYKYELDNEIRQLEYELETRRMYARSYEDLLEIDRLERELDHKRRLAAYAYYDDLHY